MKATVNIEIFDNSSMSDLEEFGITIKFLKMCFEAGFEKYLQEVCKDGTDYTLSVEVEDNTAN